MTKALISNWVHLPLSEISAQEIDVLKRHLTFLPKIANSEDNPEPILLYRETPQTFSIPVATPADILPENVQRLIEEADYDLAEGHHITFPKRPDPNHPAVKDPIAQRLLMDNMLQAAQDNIAFLAQAMTGTGKTACALNTIAELQKNALVIVPTKYLANQWVTSAKNLIGATDEDIGFVGDGKFEVEGKKIVIAIINSIAMKDDYPEWFYSYFGIVVADEVHRAGSQVFCRALPRFNARHKIGLSATPKRKDGADIVIQYHCGQVRAYSEAEALHTKVYAIGYDSMKPVWGKEHGAIVKCLTLDNERNKLIVKIIKKLYSYDRNILVVSDSINHLQNLMALCALNGIPREVMGQFTGQKYFPNGDKKAIKREELEYIQKHSKIIFATYQMMKEGVDIPRLDAGIDATPRADAIQLVGRIRRPFPDKPKPVWYTIIDRGSSRLIGYYRKRKREYVSTNMEVVEHG